MKSRKPLVYIFCCVYMYFSFAIVNRAHNAFEVGDFNQAYQKPLSNQAYHSSEVGTFTQAYQETLIKQRLSTIWGEKLKPDLPGNSGKTRKPGFWDGKFQLGPPGKPGNTRLTKHLGLRLFRQNLSYHTFKENYNQAFNFSCLFSKAW